MFNPQATPIAVALCLLLVGRAADAESLRGSTTEPETQTCKSIIAVGSTYLPDPDKQLLDIDGNVVYVDAIDDDGGVVVISYEDANTEPSSYDETFVCELNDGNTLPIETTDEQLRELQDLLN